MCLSPVNIRGADMQMTADLQAGKGNTRMNLIAERDCRPVYISSAVTSAFILECSEWTWTHITFGTKCNITIL